MANQTYERGEGELPLAAQRARDELAAVGGAPERIEEALTALHEHQEHEQRAEQRYDEPPIVLKER